MLLPRAEHTEAKIGLKFEFPACRCQILPSPGILAFSYAIWAILYVLKILNANLIKGNKHRMILRKLHINRIFDRITYGVICIKLHKYRHAGFCAAVKLENRAATNFSKNT